MSKKVSKASLETMYELHNKVASTFLKLLESEQLSVQELTAITKFLKDNNITVDIVESESVMSITESITKIANNSNKPELSVEDMLRVAIG